MISFNKPFLTGKETHFIYDAVYTQGKLSGNGHYTKLCQDYFKEKYNFRKCLLTTSCTDALEMCSILIDVIPGDEIIVPSYTFVSSANAFVLRGANIIFADSKDEHPNISPDQIKKLITPKTKAIVVVHYAGFACEMDEIKNICDENNIFLIEDAAQAIDSFYKGKPLGSFGDLATMSFHETKNIISGEGGMLIINNEKFIKRSEVIWEKGTNRAAFFRGEVNKYGWSDLGSSFLPSELTSAFLYAQLMELNTIQSKRKSIWNSYNDKLQKLKDKYNFKLHTLSPNTTVNGHLFYMICDSLETRDKLIQFLRNRNIYAVFHYLSLHSSPFYKDKYKGSELPNSDMYSERLLRLPLFVDLKKDEIEYVVSSIEAFYSNKKLASLH
jgi:dTDP-4-amino-4,6-dideoxygalactose transaminase|tara:strand:+ start:2250 stop:3401 length:1152 start_codon:yes stop_codon:yes gene_type:complete